MKESELITEAQALYAVYVTKRDSNENCLQEKKAYKDVLIRLELLRMPYNKFGKHKFDYPYLKLFYTIGSKKFLMSYDQMRSDLQSLTRGTPNVMTVLDIIRDPNIHARIIKNIRKFICDDRTVHKQAYESLLEYIIACTLVGYTGPMPLDPSQLRYTLH